MIKLSAALLIPFLLLSCSDDDESTPEEQYLVPGEPVTIPDENSEDIIEEIVPEPQESNTFGFTSRVLKKSGEEVYYFSALVTNDYDKQNLQAEANLTTQKTLKIDADFGDLVLFRIETPESMLGQKISTPYQTKLKDSYISLSFHSIKTSNRIQLCMKPVFKQNYFFEDPIVYKEDYYFGPTYGLFPNQSKFLAKWQSSHLGDYYDSLGERLPCELLKKDKYKEYVYKPQNQDELNEYLTAGPSTIRLHIAKGLKIREFHGIDDIERVGLEAIMKIEFLD